MTKIFISYRRDDSRETTERLHDQMIIHFGEENVFQDVDNIPVGENFRKYLQDEIAKCDVVLVVIGPDWGRIMQERAQQNNDFVRIEVESALKLGKFVVPVTVKEAKMPDMSQLPDSIQELGELNAANLRFNPHFKQDCQRLAEALKEGLARRHQQPFTPQFPVLAALTRARNFIREGKKNSDWTPFIAPVSDLKSGDVKIPDMRFCLVPTGKFMMGSDNGFDNEKPVHQQTVDKLFYIAQYPLTNAQWALGVKAKVVGEPQGEEALKWYKDPQMMNAPVVGVSWFDCQKFAVWMGCNLPTEREWEYAARGVESLNYPWGNYWDENKVVWSQNSGFKPNDVMTKPTGVSWVGASHLIGNVWEWMASLYENYPYVANNSRERDTGGRIDIRRVVRGNSWSGFQDDAHITFRFGNFPDFRDFDYGFRLVLRPLSLGV